MPLLPCKELSILERKESKMSEVDTETQVAMNIKLQEDTKEYVKHILHELLQSETVLFNLNTVDHLAQRMGGSFYFNQAVVQSIRTQIMK